MSIRDFWSLPDERHILSAYRAIERWDFQRCNLGAAVILSSRNSERPPPQGWVSPSGVGVIWVLIFLKPTQRGRSPLNCHVGMGLCCIPNLLGMILCRGCWLSPRTISEVSMMEDLRSNPEGRSISDISCSRRKQVSMDKKLILESHLRGYASKLDLNGYRLSLMGW